MAQRRFAKVRVSRCGHLSLLKSLIRSQPGRLRSARPSQQCPHTVPPHIRLCTEARIRSSPVFKTADGYMMSRCSVSSSPAHAEIHIVSQDDPPAQRPAARTSALSRSSPLRLLSSVRTTR